MSAARTRGAQRPTKRREPTARDAAPKNDDWPSMENTRAVTALCDLLEKGAQCSHGAFGAGSAAGELYLEILRDRSRTAAWRVVDLHNVIDAIFRSGGRGNRMMLFGFVSALHWELYWGARATTPSERKSTEELLTAVRGDLDKTQREVDREFNSDRSKRGWITRRERESRQEARS